MPSYVIDNKGSYCYIKESHSYWDKDSKKSKCIQKNIGRVDISTGRIILYPDFINSCELDIITIKGYPIYVKNQNNYFPLFNDKFKNNIITRNSNITSEINSDSILDTHLIEPINQKISPLDIHSFKNYGATYFLSQIIKKIGLYDIIINVFPKKATLILNLIFFIILVNKKMNHCTHFANQYYVYSDVNMKSQRISEFFDRITMTERNKFHKKWIKLVKENEYLALDITSVSSDSTKLEEVSYGHNKENNKMKQFNLCMLFGENTYYPMYQTIYHGILTDVKTLKNTIEEFSAVVGGYNFQLVMDKGFYSKENIDFMIGTKELKFILGVPLTNNYAKKLVELAANNIDKISNYIKTTTKGDNIKGLHFFITPNNESFKIINKSELNNCSDNSILSAFVYFNNNQRVRDYNKFCKKLSEIKNEILIDNNKAVKHKYFADKYLNIIYDSARKSIKDINIKDEQVEKCIFNYGYSVLISNSNLNTEQVYRSYVKKDVVEKSFHHFKEYLGLDRPYLHGNKRLINKSFIIQICQIVYCHIHKVMQDNDLFNKFTIPEILDTLNELKTFNIVEKQYIRPITAIQQKIYKYFRIETPKIDKNYKISF
jgi:transposase